MSLSIYTLNLVLQELNCSRDSYRSVLESLELEHLKDDEQLKDFIDERLFECSCCGVWKDLYYLSTEHGYCLECYPDDY
jgi:hypothetical protein